MFFPVNSIVDFFAISLLKFYQRYREIPNICIPNCLPQISVTTYKIARPVSFCVLCKSIYCYSYCYSNLRTVIQDSWDESEDGAEGAEHFV